MLRASLIAVFAFASGLLLGRLLSSPTEAPAATNTLSKSLPSPSPRPALKTVETVARNADAKPAAAIPPLPNTAAPRFSEEERTLRLMHTAVNRAGLLVDLDRRFGEFFRQLNLDPQTSAKLRDTLAGRENIKYLVQIALENDGLERDAAMAAELTQAEEAKMEAELRDILGVEGLKAFHAFNNTLYQQEVATDIGTRLRILNLDLTDAQRAALVSAHLQAEPQPFNAPQWDSDASVFDAYLKKQGAIVDTMLSSAGKDLSEVQRQEIRRYFDEKLEPLKRLREISARRKKSAS